jgi:hypothetical protein
MQKTVTMVTVILQRTEIVVFRVARALVCGSMLILHISAGMGKS